MWAGMPTILIVDDDQHARTLMARVLEHAPGLQGLEVRVLFAGDGVEGLEMFRAESPDLVICDLLMPRMDGFEMCSALREDPKGKDVGLIVTSGLLPRTGRHERIVKRLGAAFSPSRTRSRRSPPR